MIMMTMLGEVGRAAHETLAAGESWRLNNNNNNNNFRLSPSFEPLMSLHSDSDLKTESSLSEQMENEAASHQARKQAKEQRTWKRRREPFFFLIKLT
jgi:hypothetical protein